MRGPLRLRKHLKIIVCQIFVVGFGLMVALAAAKANELTISEIRALEASVKMPARSYPLASYARFYTLASRDEFHQLSPGNEIIWGIYLTSSWKDEVAGIHISEFHEMPLVADGGCGVINVYFDRRTRRVIEIYCNGVA